MANTTNTVPATFDAMLNNYREAFAKQHDKAWEGKDEKLLQIVNTFKGTGESSAKEDETILFYMNDVEAFDAEQQEERDNLSTSQESIMENPESTAESNPDNTSEAEASTEETQSETETLTVPVDLEKLPKEVQDNWSSYADGQISKDEYLNTNLEFYSECYATGVIDEADLISLVERDILLPGHYKAITGDEYVGVDDSSDFQQRKMTLEERLAGGALNQDGAKVLVSSWKNKNEISSEDADRLYDWLDGSNAATSSKRDEILGTYRPSHESIEDIKQDAQETVKGILNATLETETSRFSRLVLVLADFAYLLMQERKLPVLPDMYLRLSKEAEDAKLFGELVEEKDERGAILSVTNPYRDPAIQPYLKPACMAACLLAYGEATRVTFGYISKDRASGKRMSSQMVFERSVPEDGNGNYLRAVCVPANLLRPHVWMSTRPEIVKDGKAIPTWTLKPVSENTDESLRYLTKEVGLALYQHYFADEELIYDTVSETNRVPTGMISGSQKPVTQAATTEGTTTPSEPQTRQTGGTQAEGNDKDAIIKQLKEDNARLDKDLRAVAEANKGDIVSALNALGAFIRSDQPMPNEAIELLLHDAADLIDKRIYAAGNKLPEARAVYEMARILDLIEKTVDWNAADGVYEVSTIDGTLHREYEIDLKKGTIKPKGNGALIRMAA